MDTLETILDTGIIAIARGIYGDKLINASSALYKGGVRAFEVTFEQGGENSRTAEAVVRLRKCLPSDAVIGAGTVLTPAQAELANEAGASFIISPKIRKSLLWTIMERSQVYPQEAHL